MRLFIVRVSLVSSTYVTLRPEIIYVAFPLTIMHVIREIVPGVTIK